MAAGTKKLYLKMKHEYKYVCQNSRSTAPAVAAAVANARVDVRDFSRQRPKTGEEGAFEMDDDGEIGDGRLGLTTKEDLARMIAGLGGGGRLFEDPGADVVNCCCCCCCHCCCCSCCFRSCW